MAEQKISSLTPQQQIRLRIEAYVSQEGRNTAVKELYNNSQDEFIRRGKKDGKIYITIDGDRITVRDNAGGLPVNKQKDANGKLKSAIFLVYQPFVGSNYEQSTGNVSGSFGVGSAVVNATSTHFDVTVRKNKKKYELSFRDGIAIDENPKVSDWDGDEDGTEVSFILDSELYSRFPDLNIEALKRDLKEGTALIEGLEIHLDNNGEKEIFKSPNGLADLFPEGKGEVTVFSGSTNLSRIRSFADGTTSTVVDDLGYDIAIRPGETGYSATFANIANTSEGGSHEQAFSTALTNAVGKAVTKRGSGLLKQGEEPPAWNDIAPFIEYIFVVKIPNPAFKNFEKTRLNDDALRKKIIPVIEAKLIKFLEKNPDVVKKSLERSRERELLKAQRAEKRKKSSKGADLTFSMPGKLIDSKYHFGDDKYGDETCIHIAEGDSAVGGLTLQRNSDVQAVFPIRGKIQNTWKGTLASIIKKETISDLISVISGGKVGSNFEVDRDLRYANIIFTCDADPDGGDIQSLLLCMVYRLLPGTIEDGRVFSASPPLFIITETKSKKEHYCQNETERDEVILKLNSKKIAHQVIRAKGLGEMGAKSIKYTLMDPNTRVLNQYSVESEESIKALEEELGLWFSSDADSRKNIIQMHSREYGDWITE